MFKFDFFLKFDLKLQDLRGFLYLGQPLLGSALADALSRMKVLEVVGQLKPQPLKDDN